MLRACNPQRPFFVSSKDYLIIWQTEETYKKNFSNRPEVVAIAKDLISRGVILCVLCHGSLKYHGCYRRSVRDGENNKLAGWVAQAHCVNCDVYPALIGDFIMPHKHYNAEVIEKVLATYENGDNVEKISDCAADASTMRRWINQFKARAVQAIGQLLSILLSLCERQISLLKLQEKALLKQLARILCEFALGKPDSIIGRANIILSSQNFGFL